ncbi:MAG: M20 family metallopeptidase [Mycoplasmatales bacterium]
MNKEIELKVEDIKDELMSISKNLFDNPETTDTEVYACKLLTDYLIKKGFDVQIDISGHKTGFIATYDTKVKGAAVGITAEYDALEGLGHACGHNIIAASSIGSAVVLKDTLTCGKIVVFGTPGEEGGYNGGSKASYVNDGLFDLIDYSCSIHPGEDTYPTCDYIACRSISIEFFGASSHASFKPWEGCNALDAMINLYNQINALRQQLKPDVRIHGVITHGGDAPNITPNYTKALFYVRAYEKEDAQSVLDKVETIAQASATGAFCTTKVIEIENANDNMLTNNTLDQLFVEEFIQLGETVCQPPKGNGSTDVGNISHVVPTSHPTVKIGPSSLVYHTNDFRDATIKESGIHGMLVATKAIVSVVLKISTNEKLLEQIKQDFKLKKIGKKWDYF